MSAGGSSKARFGPHGRRYGALCRAPASPALLLRSARVSPGLSISRRVVRLCSEEQTKEDTMGAKGEAFAKQFEAKVEEAIALSRS